jgi:chemotaxis signal transduction protein
MAAANGREYLGCWTGQAFIAVDIDFVQEVFETRRITRLPGCPGFIAGMVSLRGTVVPVIDLFDVFEKESDVKNIVLLKTSQGPVGILISFLNDLVRFDSQQPGGTVPPSLAAVEGSVRAKGMKDGKGYYVVDVEHMIAATLPAT